MNSPNTLHSILRGHVNKEVKECLFRTVMISRLTTEKVWQLVQDELTYLKPPGYCATCKVSMNATGTTPQFPTCNTWTCSVCHTVEPETGSDTT